MKVVIWTLCALFSLASVALAEESVNHNKTTFNTETIVSQPYKRASFAVENRGITGTGGFISSEGRKFGFLLGGYKFKKELNDEGNEVYTEPHIGFASGSSTGGLVVFGNRFEVTSKQWLAASWVDHYRDKGLSFTTCEPLAELLRGVGKGFYFGGTSSCYIGPANEHETINGGHETTKHQPAEYWFFVGPTLAFRKGGFYVGTSYELGKHNERFLGGYASFSW